MQEKYFLDLQGQVNKSKVVPLFILLVLYIDIKELTKLPRFTAIKNKALPLINVNMIFGRIGIHAVHRNKLGVIKFLEEECQFTNLGDVVDGNGISLFHEACVYGYRDLIVYFLEHGANVNLVDNFGQTGLHRLALKNNCAKLIQVLKSYGANLDVRDSQDCTPLHLAVLHKNNDCATALRRCGANTQLLLQDLDLSGLTRAVAQGNITTGPLPRLENYLTEVQIKERVRAQFSYALLLTARDEQIFRTVVKDFIAVGSPLVREDCLHIVDSYLLGVSADPNQIIHFLSKNMANNKFSLVDVACIILRISMPFIASNQITAIVKFLEFITPLLLKEQQPSDEFADIVSSFIVIANGAGLYTLTETYAKHALSLVVGSNNPTTIAHIHYNLGQSKTARMQYAEARSCYEKAFSFLNNDTDIFKNYWVTVLRLSLSEALAICRSSNCGDFTTVATTYTLVLLGVISYQQALTKLDANYSDESTKILALDVVSDCHLRLKNYQLAIEYGKKALALKIIPRATRDYGDAIMLYLKLLIECNQYEQALQDLRNFLKTYQLDFSKNYILITFAALIYLGNNLTDEAEAMVADLLQEDHLRRTLSDLYTCLAISEINHGEYESAHVRKYLDFALKFNPDNHKAKFYKLLVSILDHDKQSFAADQNELDSDLVIDVTLENDLLSDRPHTDELQIEDYDPVKIHKFFQAQKREALLSISDSISSTPEPVCKWTVQGKRYLGDNPNLVSLNSNFYPDHFAVIDPELKLDQETMARFQVALNKGVCRRKYEQNGIKFISRSVIELKIDDGIRLYTTAMYINQQGKYLIIFDHSGNHQAIKDLVSSKNRIDVIAVIGEADNTFKADKEYAGVLFTEKNVIGARNDDDDEDDKKEVETILSTQQEKPRAAEFAATNSRLNH